MTVEQHEISIEITCTNPPLEALPDRESAYLGIQKGDTVVDATPVEAECIMYHPLLVVRRHLNGTPTFHGPFAHGPRDERFIYLVWAVQEPGKPARTFGRIKLHLNHIEWQAIEQAVARDKPIKVTLPLTNTKGKAVLASVRSDAAQWSL